MSSGVKVKICGLRRPAEARAAVEAGADMLGVVLCEARRRVSHQEAREILGEAPSGIQKVGIFVDPTIDEVEAAVVEAGIEVAQLCGSESPEFCERLTIPTMKSFRVTDNGIQPDPDAYSGPILHVEAPNVPGGAGLEWDWTQAAGLTSRFKVLLAGGLKPQNVGDVIAAVSPWGVDVSSGVESDGSKDVEKIRRFVAAAKS